MAATTLIIFQRSKRSCWPRCSLGAQARCLRTQATPLVRARLTARCLRHRSATSIGARSNRRTSTRVAANTPRIAATKAERRNRNSWCWRRSTSRMSTAHTATALRRSQRLLWPLRVLHSCWPPRKTRAHSPTRFTTGPNEPNNRQRAN